MKQQLFCIRKESNEYADELALKSMILTALSQSNLPEEKIAELLKLDHVLEYLQGMCQSVMAVSLEEIDDMLTSCSGFQR